MTALTMGNTARNLSAYLPHLPIAPIGRKRKESPLLVFKQSRTGVIAYRKDTPVAWIVLGYHQGQVGGKPKTTTFVDVAYHRQTLHGINLETFECANLQDAKTALFTLFAIPQEKQGSTATPFSALAECEASDNGGAN
ncbi:hypothetical protein [Thiothrix winogradskyi]|uniref:Uncharacterized protein n=1 Tax=Thiothrix winogradskyi TaxID=96472 RepID=A0ABY3SWV9_9GAMM|nr:hypothetical protein [Thiothrix winogradskyi]UJS23369.1 hypothetical protein L2Y54_15660 [Thiothrix winogradskyi]